MRWIARGPSTHTHTPPTYTCTHIYAPYSHTHFHTHTCLHMHTHTHSHPPILGQGTVMGPFIFFLRIDLVYGRCKFRIALEPALKGLDLSVVFTCSSKIFTSISKEKGTNFILFCQEDFSPACRLTPVLPVAANLRHGIISHRL